MVSMAMKAEKEGKSDSCCCCAPCSCDTGKPRFPWGLQLTLENEQMQALGMAMMPKVGESMELYATVKITSCNESERVGEEPARSVSLQITDLGLEMPKAAPMDKAKVASALYDKPGA